MAPILIDRSDLLKLGFVSVLATILVFSGGFLIGHQRAAISYQAGSEIQSLTLPEPVIAVENIVDSQMPETIEAGEEIDVDQPETMMQPNDGPENSMPDSATVAVTSSENKETSASQKNVNTAITEITDIEQQSEYNKDNLTTEIQTSKLQSTETVTNPNDSSRVVKENINPIDASLVTSFTLDELSKIKYSIQVGVYGRLINAENMMKMLLANRYDAYVTDYTNKKNEIRYNVRIGYFTDKKSAIATLRKFKANQKGDGYLVKFSADDIVKIAGTVDIEQAVDVPAHSNEVEKRLTTVTVPSEITQDKISQVDFLNDMPAITRPVTTN